MIAIAIAFFAVLLYQASYYSILINKTQNEIALVLLEFGETMGFTQRAEGFYEMTLSIPEDVKKSISNAVESNLHSLTSSTMYFVYGVFVIIFGVFTSFYRFHSKEISKQEHYLLGFHRIRIAGNKSSDGFDGNVNLYLTKDAFDFSIVNSNRKVRNPLPGHPGSDLTSEVINRVFNLLDSAMKRDRKEEDA